MKIEKNQESLKSQYERQIKKSSYHNLCSLLAWRCLLCNTVNGLQGHKREVRSLCLKCRRARTNPLSFKQELDLQEDYEVHSKVIKISKLLGVSLDKSFEIVRELEYEGIQI